MAPNLPASTRLPCARRLAPFRRFLPRTGATAVAAMLFLLSSADAASLRGLGPKLGEFVLEEIPLPRLKRSASRPPLPEGSEGLAQAMARVGAGFDPASLDAYGWRMAGEYQGFASLEGDPAMLPLLQAVAGTPEGPAGLLELRPSRPATGTMQAARLVSRADEVIDWGPAPAKGGVSGKGILVGVIDYGFDTRHPAFLDSAGRSRFVGIWDPNRPKKTGAPFGRGELKWRAGLEADPDFGVNEGDHHGTLVASIAAGSDSSRPYYGVAPRSEILGVNLSTPRSSSSGDNNIMQGIQWIFHVADSLGRPCVINLSLGNLHMGPHDGTSLFDRFIDSIAGPGRLVVGAAGNDGNKSLHARFTLASGDTAGSWCPAPGMVDLWGETGKAFRVQMMVVDTATGAYVNQSTFLSTSNGTGRMVGDSINWTDPRTGRRIPILIMARPERAAPENGKPHMEIYVQPGSEDTALALVGLRMGFRITGTGTVHAWNGSSDAFVTAGMGGYSAGDNDYSVSEIGGTAKRILSAGAYVSTKTFTDYTGVAHPEIVKEEEGGLAAWSSLGPTADGRIKPDLAAPGKMVVGAFSRTVVDPPQWLRNLIVEWPAPPSLERRYFAAEGTSEASPFLAGTVALMLEAKPALTPEEARTILSSTAYRDAFTGSSANGHWGYGKLDVGAAVRKLKDVPVGAGDAGARDFRPVSARFLGGRLRVSGLADAASRGSLYDWRGRLLSALDSSGDGFFSVRAGTPGPGVYFAVLRSPSGVHRLRVCKP